MRTTFSLFVSIAVIATCGCADHRSPTTVSATGPAIDSLTTQPSTQASTQPANLADLSFDSDVIASVAPPLGWHTDPLKKSSRHKHQVWVSPTGSTAYGVAHFDLPLPVGTDLVLWGFLDEMKKTEGEANLISKKFDPAIKALRFDVQGGLYHVHANLSVDGFQGWLVYAGTLRHEPVNDAEYAQAIAAREATRVGK